MKRLFVTVGLSAMLLASCTTHAPTAQDIQNGVKFFDVTRPDGTKMTCLSYDSFQNDGNGNPHVVFAIDCDWSGKQHLG